MNVSALQCMPATAIAAPLAVLPGAPWLAPLAGWSDLPFRLLCREYGAAVCCTEMISAKGLVYERRTGGRASRELLTTVEGDAPLVVQLFGDDPYFVGEAVRMLAHDGWPSFDCNMGCAVPKVTRTGAGAALLRDPARALAVGQAMLDAVRASCAPGLGQVGFKLRLGWEPGQETGLELARCLEDAGAAWVTLHPRTARQGFTGTARWEALTELCQRVQIPVIASGDLWTARDGLRCMQQTGVQGVMYARGALRDPALFARHRALYAASQHDTTGHADTAERPPVDGVFAALQAGMAPDAEGDDPAILHARIRRHAELARTLSTPHTALLKMRTAIPRYVRHLSGARALRQAIIMCRDWDTFDEVLEAYFAQAHPVESMLPAKDCNEASFPYV